MHTDILHRVAIALLALLCLPVLTRAHDGSIRGKVKDGKTGKGLEGADIYMEQRSGSTVTNALGQFLWRHIEPGNYEIIISHTGFETVTRRIAVEEGVTTDIDVTLLASPVSLAEVTVNAVKSQAVSTISDVDIRLRPVNNAQDLMRLVPGVFTAQHQGGGKAEQMFLRGFDIDHGTDINVSVDEMPVNMVSHAHGQGYADLHFLIPELVERIDFGKGPYQVDKGDFTTAGFASFKTFDRLEQSFVKAEGGLYGYLRSVAAIDLLNSKRGEGKASAYLAGAYCYNRGYFEAPQGFNRMNLMGKYNVQLTRDKQLTLTLSGFSSHWQASGQVPARAVAKKIIGRFGGLDPEWGTTSRYNFNIQYLQSLGDHSIFRSNAYVSYYDFDLVSNFTFFLKDPENGDQIRQKERRLLTGYNAKYSTDYHIGRFRARTEAGLGFRFDNSMDVELSHTIQKETRLQRLALGDIYQTNLYAYTGQTIYISPQLVLTAGLRFDHFIHDYNNKLPAEPLRQSYYTKGFSPKAGLYYNFNNNGRIYFNYGTGFHSNDTRVVVRQQGREVLPMAHSFDLGTVVKPFPRVLLSGALWLLDLQQEFVYVGDEAVVEPSGRTRRAGIDLSLRYELLPFLFLDGDFNYTYARSRDEVKGADYIPLAAKITSIGGLTYKQGRWVGSLRYRYLGDRPANEDNSVVAYGYTVWDATASYTISRFEFGLQVQNMLNTAWNEAQFDTESRLRNEAEPVSEIHFTPGTPFFLKLTAMFRF